MVLKQTVDILFETMMGWSAILLRKMMESKEVLNFVPTGKFICV